MGGYQIVSRTRLPSYVAEFQFRYNTCLNAGVLRKRLGDVEAIMALAEGA
jgi:hypothetical protein